MRCSPSAGAPAPLSSIERRAGEALLVVRVEHDGVGDGRAARAGERDRLRAPTPIEKFDGLGAGDRVRVQDELAERALLQPRGAAAVVVGRVAAGVDDRAEAEARVDAGDGRAGDRRRAVTCSAVASAGGVVGGRRRSGRRRARRRRR